MLMKKVTAKPGGDWSAAPFDGKRYIVRIHEGVSSGDYFIAEGFCKQEDWSFYVGGTDEFDSTCYSLLAITHYYPVDQITFEGL